VEKQQAIDFILEKLDLQRSKEEISSLLAQQINASPAQVGNFVDQVIQQRKATLAILQTEPDPVAVPSISEEKQTGNSIPPDPSLDSSGMNPALVPEEPPLARQGLAAEDTLPPCEKHHLPKLSDENIEKSITSALNVNHDLDDVILAVCEKTGLTWDQAQGFVANVATQNRKNIVLHQNLIFIPLSALAILAGFILFHAGFSEGYSLGSTLLNRAADKPFVIPPNAAGTVQSAPWAILTGLGLAVGGIFGLFRALKSQFE